mmetsp:Transcript_4529/g.11800  ORF Transcript_4529/g.11800 Transcript_4529/m.11800 type:complete len:215 (+) Transcript_4529:166-810(+)
MTMVTTESAMVSVRGSDFHSIFTMCSDSCVSVTPGSIQILSLPSLSTASPGLISFVREKTRASWSWSARKVTWIGISCFCITIPAESFVYVCKSEGSTSVCLNPFCTIKPLTCLFSLSSPSVSALALPSVILSLESVDRLIASAILPTARTCLSTLNSIVTVWQFFGLKISICFPSFSNLRMRADFIRPISVASPWTSTTFDGASDDKKSDVWL